MSNGHLRKRAKFLSCPRPESSKVRGDDLDLDVKGRGGDVGDLE